MEVDVEGFAYPRIDPDRCRRCGRCEAVCPVLHPRPVGRPSAVYAARVNDDGELLKASSSGGVFSLLAARTLAAGGVVFGAVWDDRWTVVHRSAEDTAGVSAMRGSKYLQSRADGCYAEVRRHLDAGRPVLFSGTPCQVAALRGFLNRDTDELLTVEVICHGVPSPEVWLSYLGQYPGRLTGVSMRDKSLGWPRSVTRLDYADGTVRKIEFNCFAYAFAVELCNRPSCSECPARSPNSAADLTLGDFGGIDKVAPEFDDGKGVSCVLVRTEKGRKAFDAVRGRCEVREAGYEQVLARNPNLERSFPPHPLRKLFIRRALTVRDFDGWVRKCVTAGGLSRLWLRTIQFFTNGGSGR